MGSAMLSGVTGMTAHQTMIDVAGNNLANMNTTAFKSSRVTFADLMASTLAPASQPTDAVGGTNPMQIGSGVRLGSVDRNMTQGSIITTGQPLDMAIEGAGYFVLNTGREEVYTRVGSFAVDSDYFLVDPATGYRVQRTGEEGVAEGFQQATSDAIRIPYDMALPANATSEIRFNGNLSSDERSATTNLLASGIQYAAGGAGATETTLLTALDQTSGNIVGASLIVTGTDRDGNAVDNSGAPLVIGAATDIATVLAEIDSLYSGSTAALINGEIRLTDDTSGYSQTELNLSLSGGPGGTLELPDDFTVLEAGGTVSRNVNVEIFDTQGVSYTLSGAFVGTDTSSMWDFVVTTVSGDVDLVDRRVRGISFQADGSYAGLDTGIGDAPSVSMQFGTDPGTTRTIAMNLGTVNEFDGLSQFGGAFTVAQSGQDGYSSGSLASVSATREGVLVGVFTNGVRQDIAAIRLATFQNPAGLDAIGGNYFRSSGNSGSPVPTRGMAGGAGGVQGGALESSNVDVATEFVNLIKAQNGYQANARTIRVSTEMLQELSNLIR